MNKNENKSRIIAPSLLSSDFLNLGDEIKMLNESEAEWIHLDVMDGVFVPNISFGMPIISAVRKATKKLCDVHLMIKDPNPYLETFKEAGADVLSVHYETCDHLHRTVSKIRDLDMKAGVVLNPHTPVSLLKNILPYIDLVLLMSVNPGFGGQKFISEIYSKIEELKDMITSRDLDVLIEVDGGVNDATAPALFEKGANVLVAGSYVFGSSNPKDAIHRLLLS